MNLLTTAQVAERLGISRRHVNHLIADGRLKAIPFGEALRHETGVQPVAWLVNEADLNKFAEGDNWRRPRGRRYTKRKKAAG